MLSSKEIRQSYFDFFKSKDHTLVSSASLMPDSPNLLFTNAGMNQFVPIFLGEKKCPYTPGRATDTQKCIRAGGKHNDLEDVGMDTYHHTFFEMLGNWSFNDYFKNEAIEYAWEYLTNICKIPKERLYATVYQPDKSIGDPSEFDQEAYDIWAKIFKSEGLDPAIHIVNGDKKDNFWMMGETGPCGPCTELHIDLTPAGDTKGSLVNMDTDKCIEIWNLVFIQMNANPDGTFSDLPTKNVDTGMGFERLASIILNTKNFTDFNGIISNYETDIFTPIFDKLTEISGKKYTSTLPEKNELGDFVAANDQEMVDIAFRVIADHIRTLSFSIADGIQPGNGDRNYVLRRILRRAVRYGRTIGLEKPFFYELVDTLADQMGEVFPELAKGRQHVKTVIKSEEEAFNRTLDRGINLFESEISKLKKGNSISGAFAFRLADEQGFPLDLTELMAREQGFKVDVAGFEKLMNEQRERARAAQKKEIISLSEIKTTEPTEFIGYDEENSNEAQVKEVIKMKNGLAVIFDSSVCYPEMGGQVGDSGTITAGGKLYQIKDTQKNGDATLHYLVGDEAPEEGEKVIVSYDIERRNKIRKNHTATHLLHKALQDLLGEHVEQKGSLVAADYLRFDFSHHQGLKADEIEKLELLINEKVIKNSAVETHLKNIDDAKAMGAMALFGEKYDDDVRVVKIDDFSLELCGGTHVKRTGDIGLFKITSEGSVSAGIRRIEAITGMDAVKYALNSNNLLQNLAGDLKCKVDSIPERVTKLSSNAKSLQKELDEAKSKLVALEADSLLEKAEDINGIKVLMLKVDNDAATLKDMTHSLRKKIGSGIVVFASAANGKVVLTSGVSDDLTKLGFKAGEIVSVAAKQVGGGGGGAPTFAQAGGRMPEAIPSAFKAVKELIESK
ncbi:alanine--tRNA ligase [Lentisphaera marina]|uniref:alanine--tRNA ligase n=1 Tax=Lentisphaera marina TaxID=1111041 RepID=UPI002366C471|nr:alanine--tRNA ligase [Lentisphaera marina]MDD7983846.1 alanine--tRNA ligase [Lentisphaera marina]